MTIDWLHFTPYSALLGGLVLGAAAALLLLFNGRILGVSGILGGLLSRRRGDILWRFSFLLGLLCAPLLYYNLLPGAIFQPRISSNLSTLIVAGLLVGLGSRYGVGCTSGHGICGLARLSPRSLLATLLFMFAGFITVYMVRHFL